MVKTGNRKLIVALLLAMFLAAVEGTIVTLAIPTIVNDLHGFNLISHVFSVYLLTGSIATPVYGKLSDLYGRKRILIIGISIFLFGSALCGLAQNMTQLIVFRGIQGIGAGSIFTVPMTIVGDTFSLEQRGKVQGLLSSVWGIAGLMGPFLGGLLIDLASWHWIFFINIPFGVLTLIIIQVSFKENFQRRPHSIDFLGLVILALSMTAFLSIFIFNTHNADYLTWQNLIFFVIAAILIVVFVFLERRVQEPIVPMDVFSRSSIVINVVSFLFTAALLGVDVYLPIYLQNVYGLAPLLAGLTILPMTISWILVTIPLGKMILRLGIKFITLSSLILALTGVVLMLVFNEHTQLILLILIIFWLGIGFGIANTSQTMFIQDSVGYEKRGSAVAVNSLVRSLGQTIGISVFGAVFNFSIIAGFAAGNITKYDLGNLYDMSAYESDVAWSQIAHVLAGSVHAVTWVLIALIVASIIAALFLPRTVRAQKNVDDNRPKR